MPHSDIPSTLEDPALENTGADTESNMRVQVGRSGDFLHMVLHGDCGAAAPHDASPNTNFTVTPLDATVLLKALERALAENHIIQGYPVWARLVSLFVAIGLPAGIVLSLLWPNTGADVLVPLALSAWFVMTVLLARRDRRLTQPG